jgi:hypothetical protein
MEKQESNVKTVILWVIVVVGVLAAVHATTTYVLGRRVEKRIAAIKAAGEPVSFADLQGAAIPPSQNAAVIYEKVLREYRDPGFSAEQFAEWPTGWIGKRQSDPQVWEIGREAMARNSGIVRDIEVAVSRPKCRFALKLGPGNRLSQDLFSRFGRFRELARFLGANALFNASEGRMDKAAHFVDLEFRLADSLRDEPILMSQLVRIAMLSMTTKTLCNVLQYGPIDEGQARKLYDTLSAIDLDGSITNALAGTRAFELSFFEANSRAYHIRPLVYAQELDYLKRMDKVIKESNVPSRGAPRLPTGRAPWNSISSVSADMIAQEYAKTRERGDVAKTYVAGSRITLALIAYKDRVHRYPVTLNELRAKLGWKIPTDPFSGKDFPYRREGKGFLFYSIGPDLVDNGGQYSRFSATKRPTGQSYSGETGDVVWRMEK